MNIRIYGSPKLETGAPILWPPDAKSRLIGKDGDAGKDWRQKEERSTEGKTVGWHLWLTGRELSELQETVEDRGARHAAVHGVTKSQTRLVNWTTKLETTQMSSNRQTDKDDWVNVAKIQKPTPNLRSHFSGDMDCICTKKYTQKHKKCSWRTAANGQQSRILPSSGGLTTRLCAALHFSNILKKRCLRMENRFNAARTWGQGDERVTEEHRGRSGSAASPLRLHCRVYTAICRNALLYTIKFNSTTCKFLFLKK